MAPIFGEWILKLLKDGTQKIERWQWPSPAADVPKEQKQWGHTVSWRVGAERERVVGFD
ncbi:hypothetical protein GGI43DRAFT_405700 [Trichoderma evansii]